LWIDSYPSISSVVMTRPKKPGQCDGWCLDESSNRRTEDFQGKRNCSHLGIAIPDYFSNPGISGLKNANPGMPGLNPGIESYRFWTIKISSNSLVLVSWWVFESWSICWSPVLTYYCVNNCKYFYLSSFLSSDTISPLFNVKRKLLIFIKIQDPDDFFLL